MSRFVFAPPLPTPLHVAGRDAAFAVRRVYCVGRNYAAHAREMGFSDRDPPFFFCKPTDSVVAVASGATLELDYPSATQDFQHEIELVAAIGRAGHCIPVDQALEHVWGYAVGLDMTRRDLQLAMRQQGRPWEIGKSFDRSAIIGPLRPAQAMADPGRGRIQLEVDGEVRQHADLGDLIWNVAEIVAHLSTWFELQPGDVVFTGTPAGVGPVHRGQTMLGSIDGLGELRVAIRP